MKTLFLAFSAFLMGVTIPAAILAAPITPSVGAPPPAARASFFKTVINPDMNDNQPVQGGVVGNRLPDDWSTNTPIQVKNDLGGGVTSFIQGGVLTQSLTAGDNEPSFDSFWITVTYRTFPVIIPGSGGAPPQIFDPGLFFAWSYKDSPGSIRQDFFQITGNNPTALQNPPWVTANYWGYLLPNSNPKQITFQTSMTGLADARIEIDYLNFRTGRYEEIPEPSTMLLLTTGVLAMFLWKLNAQQGRLTYILARRGL